MSEAIGDENFIKEAGEWKPNEDRQRNRETVRRNLGEADPASAGGPLGRRRGRRPLAGTKGEGGVTPEGFDD